MKKDYDSTRIYRNTQKKGASQTYDTPSYRSKEFIIIDLLTIYDKGEISNISDEFISFLLDKRENV